MNLASILATILAFLKVAKFFMDLYLERDKKKAEDMAQVGHEVVDAFKEADPKTRASRLNSAVQSIDQLRK